MAETDSVELLIGVQKPRGKWCTDGSIELSEQDLQPDARVGDRLAKAPAGALRAGINTRTETTVTGEEFHATTDGNVQINQNEIRIVPLLTVDSDIGYGHRQSGF